MSDVTVPVDTMVPISRFGRGTATAEFAKVADGRPVTVLKNSQPAYFILNAHDYIRLREAEEEYRDLVNEEARREAKNKEYAFTFDNVSDLMDHFDAL